MTPGSRVVAALLVAGLLAGCGGDEKKASPASRTATVPPPVQSPSPTRTPTTSPQPVVPSPVPPKTNRPAPPAKKPLAPVLTRIGTRDKVVFITIDDGWEKDPRFIQQVREQSVPVTVFLTNDAARENYGYFQELQQLGAPVENHTMTHPVLSRLSWERQRHEICPVQDIYATKYGARPTLLRPPCGAYNKATREVAASCGIKAIMNWTAEYKSATGRMYYQGPGGLHPGDIILWHFNPHMPRNFDRLMRIIRKQGLRPAALRDYLPQRYLQPTS